MSWLRDKYKQCIDQAKEIALEKGNQAAKKISLAKQIVKEGTGHVDCTSENPLISDNFELAEHTRFHMKQMYKTMTVALDSGAAYMMHNRQFAYAVMEAGREFLHSSPDYATSMMQIAEHLLEIESHREAMFNSIKQNFVYSTRNFAKMDIKNALLSKKHNYDEMRIEYDAEKARHTGKAEQGGSSAFAEIEERFRDVEYDTIEMLQDVNERREVDSLLYTLSLLDSHEGFLSNWIDAAGEMRLFWEETKIKIGERKREIKQERDQRDAKRRQKIKDKEPINDETRVYGTSLDKLLEREGKSYDQIPTAVDNMFSYLESRALKEEGIFRLSGAKTQVEKIKNDLDRGRQVDFSEIADCNAVSSLLKMLLRELPEPLFTSTTHSRLLSWNVDNPKNRLDYIKEIISELPQSHQALLQRLLRMLHTTKCLQEHNKMSSSNLARVFGPNLIRSNDVAFLSLESNAAINELVQFLIDEYPGIYGISSMETDLSPSLDSSVDSPAKSISAYPVDSATIIYPEKPLADAQVPTITTPSDNVDENGLSDDELDVDDVESVDSGSDPNVDLLYPPAQIHRIRSTSLSNLQAELSQLGRMRSHSTKSVTPNMDQEYKDAARLLFKQDEPFIDANVDRSNVPIPRTEPNPNRSTSGFAFKAVRQTLTAPFSMASTAQPFSLNSSFLSRIPSASAISPASESLPTSTDMHDDPSGSIISPSLSPNTGAALQSSVANSNTQSVSEPRRMTNRHTTFDISAIKGISAPKSSKKLSSLSLLDDNTDASDDPDDLDPNIQ